jgi:hypothetical protein
MRKCVITAALLALASAATPSPAPALRLRGGGVLSSLGERLGWKRDKIGPSELGCGPLPQVIFGSTATARRGDGGAFSRCPTPPATARRRPCVQWQAIHGICIVTHRGRITRLPVMSARYLRL